MSGGGELGAVVAGLLLSCRVLHRTLTHVVAVARWVLVPQTQQPRRVRRMPSVVLRNEEPWRWDDEEHMWDINKVRTSNEH
jgi:hypothetical protein